jgi:hypothetical protein
MPKRPLKLHELKKRLKVYNVTPMPSKRGKGSEIVFFQPKVKGSKQGAQFPIKNHGKSTEIYIPVINAILRRFDIDPQKFWNN